jgi:hypothetical protein
MKRGGLQDRRHQGAGHHEDRADRQNRPATGGLPGRRRAQQTIHPRQELIGIA